MNYKKIYDSLCSKEYQNNYTELHHIVPKCMGGSDDKLNLTKLSAKAHYLAHRLLCKIYPENIKLKFALNMMSRSTTHQQRYLTLDQYDTIKKENSKALSILHSSRKRNENEKLNISKALKGKPKTAEHKKKCSEWQKGKSKSWQLGRKLSEETRRKISEKKKGVKINKPYNIDVKKYSERAIEMNKKRSEPGINTEGYEILTPSGFQKFDGIVYSGLVNCLEFKTRELTIIVSNNHRFDNTSKKAKEYIVGDLLYTENGLQEITSISSVGKKQVYDVLEVDNGNLYLANGIQNHNCELIRDGNRTVIPEFDDELCKLIVKEYNKPPHYTPYVSMDLGFKDLTVVLFGYYDFKHDRVIIEDEIVKEGKDLKLNEFSEEILKKEESLWLNILTNELIKPEIRVSDVDYIVIQEINRASMNRLNFQAVKKTPGYKLPLINQLRVMLQSEKIIINPRCETLIAHLKNARWKDASVKDDFARSPGLGHYDAVDSLLYLIKSVNYSKNPYPANYGRDGQDVFYNNGRFGYKSNQQTSNMSVYESIFGIKKR